MRKDQLWKLKRYYEKVISDYYSTDEIDPDVANRIVDGLTRFMNIAEQQQQEIERLNELYLDREKSLLETISVCENFDEQLQQAQAKAERYEKALKEIAEWSGIASREYRIATKALGDES